MGGRIGYSLATGLCIGLVCLLGLVALLLAVIPLVAILPILLYIGVVIGAQAFQVTPREHAPAIVLALIPNIASWAQNTVDSALNAAGTSAEKVGMDKFMDAGVVYRGMEVLGGGAILAGMILASVAAFIIDKNFKLAAIYALAGSVLSYFGFIHGAKLGIGEAADVALGYLLLAGICYGMARQQPAASEEPDRFWLKRLELNPPVARVSVPASHDVLYWRLLIPAPQSGTSLTTPRSKRTASRNL